jgi:hypothetical protein
VDDATKKELRALYANLCKKEETPMVKRAAAANLGVSSYTLIAAIFQTVADCFCGLRCSMNHASSFVLLSLSRSLFVWVSCHVQLFASILDPKILLSEFHGLLLKLSKDEIDSVRLLVVQSCVQISKVYVREPATRQENVSATRALHTPLQRVHWMLLPLQILIVVACFD